MNQELSTEVRQQNGGMSAYNRPVEMLQFAETMGKEFASMGLCGCKKGSEGRVLALACFIERLNPFDFADRYHLIDGKRSMQADYILAELRDQGGDYDWLDEGDVTTDDSGKMVGEAVIKTTWRGREKITKYTMEEAYRAGVVKPNSGWDKRPGAMLRSKASTKAARMHFPEVLRGRYAPEELDDYYDPEEIHGEVVEEKSVRTKAEVEARAAEIRGEVEKTEPDPTPEPDEEIIDAEVEASSESEPGQSQPLGEVQEAGSGFDQAMMDLEELLGKAKVSRDRFELMLQGRKEEYPWFTTLEECNADQIRTLADRLEKKLRGE